MDGKKAGGVEESDERVWKVKLFRWLLRGADEGRVWRRAGWARDAPNSPAWSLSSLKLWGLPGSSDILAVIGLRLLLSF